MLLKDKIELLNEYQDMLDDMGPQVYGDKDCDYDLWEKRKKLIDKLQVEINEQVMNLPFDIANGLDKQTIDDIVYILETTVNPKAFFINRMYEFVKTPETKSKYGSMETRHEYL